MASGEQGLPHLQARSFHLHPSSLASFQPRFLHLLIFPSSLPPSLLSFLLPVNSFTHAPLNFIYFNIPPFLHSF